MGGRKRDERGEGKAQVIYPIKEVEHHEISSVDYFTKHNLQIFDSSRRLY